MEPRPWKSPGVGNSTPVAKPKKRKGLSEALPSWKSVVVLFRVTDDEHFNAVLMWAIFLVGVCLAAELYASRAHGKFGASAGGMSLDPRVGWWLMELPVTVTFL